jgi:hypothetical protein
MLNYQRVNPWIMMVYEEYFMASHNRDIQGWSMIGSYRIPLSLCSFSGK